VQATQFARQTGYLCGQAREGDHVSGFLSPPLPRVDLASGGRFALLKRQQFLLVPWRPIVDRQLGARCRSFTQGVGGAEQFLNLWRERGLGIDLSRARKFDVDRRTIARSSAAVLHNRACSCTASKADPLPARRRPLECQVH